MNTRAIGRQRYGNIWLFLSPFVGLVLGWSLGYLLPSVDRWSSASVVRVCHDGTKVFRMEDGEYRVRGPSSVHSFHAESADVCAP